MKREGIGTFSTSGYCIRLLRAIQKWEEPYSVSNPEGDIPPRPSRPAAHGILGLQRMR